MSTLLRPALRSPLSRITDAIRAAFGIRSALFAAGEQGVWYDPSDMTTLFQDAAGTTPVTAVEQPVGLMLDKSKGLVLGPELMTNGTFDTDTTGWSAVNATLSVVAGSLRVTKTDFFGQARSTIATVVGKTYKVSATMTAQTSAAGGFYLRVGTTAGGSQHLNCPIEGSSPATPATKTGYFLATTTTTHINVISSGNSGYDEWDNISVRELQGNHASQATSTARPVLSASGDVEWINYDGIDDVHNITFPVSLGTACTVARANVGGAPTILTAQTIGTSYAMSTDHAGLIIVNRALTASETASLTAYLTAKGAS